MKDLSGGQKRRLQLLLILLDQPNVLILDEPTNDLDTDMLAAMEDLLDTWPGTLLVVSHDRYFLERVTDQQYAILDGRLRHLPGGVDEYLRLRAHERDAPGAHSAAASALAAPHRGSPAPSCAPRRRSSPSLERRLEKLERQIAAARTALADHDQADYVGLGAEMAAHRRARGRARRRRGALVRAHRAARLIGRGRAQASKPRLSLRSSAASRSRSPRESVPSSTASASTSRVIAASTRVLPSPVRVTRMLRPSSGSASRRTSRAVDEPVDAVGHRAARDERLLQQLLGAQLERLARAAQRREHVPLPRLEVAAAERVAPRAVEVAREPVDAREHLQRREVEVGALRDPRLDDAVDLVRLLRHAPIIAGRGCRASPRSGRGDARMADLTGGSRPRAPRSAVV